MKFFKAACFCLLAWAVCPVPGRAADQPAQSIQPDRAYLLDEAAGYFTPLPEGWVEVSDPEALREILQRAGVLFFSGDDVRGAMCAQGAVFPGDAQAAPALAIFALDYETLGLDAQAADAIAKDAKPMAVALAHALQREYSGLFPHSALVNSSLGDDNFYLHLRSVLDPADEQGSTRHRYLKIIFAADAALVFAAQYDGPQNLTYELAIAQSAGGTAALAEKRLRGRLPPYEASFPDYLLFLGAGLVVVFFISRARRK